MNDEFTFVSKEGEKFKLPREYANLSACAKYCEGNTLQTDVPSRPLSLVVKYLEHHKGVPGPSLQKPIGDRTLEDIGAEKWDVDFVHEIIGDMVKGDDAKEDCIAFIIAPHSLSIKCLLYLCCAKLAYNFHVFLKKNK